MTDSLELYVDDASLMATEDSIAKQYTAMESLDTLADVVTKSLESGGLSSPASIVLTTSLNSLVGTTRVVPALESFDCDRLMSTEIALEGVGSAIKDLWEAIKKALVGMWESLQKFMQKVFAAGPGIVSKAEALLKKLDNVDGSPKEKTVDLGEKGLHAQLDGKPGSPKDVSNLEKNMRLYTNKIHKDGLKVVKDLEGAVKSLSKDKEVLSVARHMKGYLDAIKAGVPLKDDKRYPAGKGSTYFRTDLCLGDRAMVYQIQGDEAWANNVITVTAVLKETRIKYEKFPASPKLYKLGAFPTLSVSEMSSICEDIKSMGTLITDYQRNFLSNKKELDSILKTADSIEDDIAKNKDDSKNAKDKNNGAFSKAACKFSGQLLKVPVLLMAPTITSCQVMLLYVDKSISLYE